MPELDCKDLYAVCDPNSFDFKTTAEIRDGAEIIGQPRAVEAITFGVELRGEGYNIFALGPEGVGRRFLVENHLKTAALGRAKPFDICYVNNLGDLNKPRLLTLPAGLATGLKEDIERLMEDIGVALPRAFEAARSKESLSISRELAYARPNDFDAIRKEKEKL